MKLGKFIIATIALLTLSTISQAKDYTFTVDLDFYAGGSYSSIGYQVVGADSADLNALYIQSGVTIFDWVALEARIGTTTGDADAYYYNAAVGINIDVNYFYGMYLKVGYPNKTPFYPYLIGGNSSFETTIAIDGYGKVKESESGLSYGFGTDFNLSGFNSIPTWFNFLGFTFSEFDLPDNVALNAEYIQYLDNDAVKIGGFNMGAKYLF